MVNLLRMLVNWVRWSRKRVWFHILSRKQSKNVHKYSHGEQKSLFPPLSDKLPALDNRQRMKQRKAEGSYRGSSPGRVGHAVRAAPLPVVSLFRLCSRRRRLKGPGTQRQGRCERISARTHGPSPAPRTPHRRARPQQISHGRTIVWPHTSQTTQPFSCSGL